MGRRMRRRPVGQRHHPIDAGGRQRRDARRPGLVAGQPRHPFLHEALRPAPNHGFVLADRPGDGIGALAIGGQQHDPGAPDVLLRAVAVPYDGCGGPGYRVVDGTVALRDQRAILPALVLYFT